MRAKCAVCVALLAFASAPACGGSLEGGDDVSLVVDAGGDDGGVRRDGGRHPRPDDGGDDDADYVDPSCGDASVAPPTNECDARTQTGCALGEGCYPFVSYPSGPCEQEQYGTACAPAGSGRQGDTCGGIEECAPGYVCVITGAGTACTKLCDLGQPGSCPEGEVCEPIDVAGYATCN